MVYTLPYHSSPRAKGSIRGKEQDSKAQRHAGGGKQARKWLVRLVVGLVICLAAIGAYYLLVINYVIENAPGVTWILAAIAAIFLGWFGNKFSKTHRAYTGYLAERGLTNEDVVEFLKTNGRDNPRA